MRDNINKVSQRGERLDSLQDKTDNLAVSAQGFRRGANRVRKQMWWKDMKMRMCLIVGIIILIVIIVVPAGRLTCVPSSCYSNSVQRFRNLPINYELELTHLSFISCCHQKTLNYVFRYPSFISVSSHHDLLA